MFNLNQFKKIKSAIGKNVLIYLYLSITVGLFTFFIESAFIIILQKFLQSIGVLNESIQSPSFILIDGLLASSVALVLIGTLRAIIYGLKSYSANLTQHTFICTHRIAILTAALKNSAATSTKEVISIFSDLVSASGSLMNFVSLLLVNFISAIAYFCLALYIAPNETILGILIIFLLLLPTRSLSKKVSSSGEALVQEWEKINGALITGLKNNFFLKVYNLIPKEIEFAHKSVSSYRNHIKQFSITSSLVASLPSIIGLFVLALLTYFSIQFGTSSIKLISFFYIFLKLVQSLSEMNQTFAAIRLNYPSLVKLIQWEEAINNTIEPDHESQSLKFDLFDSFNILKADIKKFSYQNETILQDIHFELNSGDILIIKGPSGVGKSTLLGLLLGILQPTIGSVEINNKKVSEVLQCNSRLIAYVGPEPFLIQGSIKDNLIYGLNEFVSDAQIFSALKAVDLYHFVMNLPHQLNQKISEVAELSTGQRQRISLARALIRPFSLLVLDEATANLDETTESEIIRTISTQLKNKIAIIVTHKSSFDEIGTRFIELKKS